MMAIFESKASTLPTVVEIKKEYELYISNQLH